MQKVLLVALMAVTFLSSCEKDTERNVGGTFRGPEVKVHDGRAWTWVQIDPVGNPVKLAVTITDAALNSVPVGHDGHTGHDHGNMDNNWNLKFHPKASVLPFTFLGMGWNPAGHEPEFIYGLPHFDFHYYMSSEAEIAAIPPYQVDSTGFLNFPAADYLPATYFNPGGGVPQMGAHWIDFTSPELNGQLFTQTFIYGSYNGKVNFYEPMITLDFLKNTSSYQRPIPQPAKVQKSGWYPTVMSVSKHDGVTDIILESFVYRTAS